MEYDHAQARRIPRGIRSRSYANVEYSVLVMCKFIVYKKQQQLRAGGERLLPLCAVPNLIYLFLAVFGEFFRALLGAGSCALSPTGFGLRYPHAHRLR